MNKELDGAITINVDFSAIEKRVADMMGRGEIRMSEISSDLLDFHKITAALLNGVKYSEVTKEQRRAAKSLNFRLMYSPGYIWQGPDEDAFRTLYSDEEWYQLFIDTRVARPQKIYEAIKMHFNAGRQP